MNLNKVFVLGNVTRDPEVRSLPNGQPVANFGLATNRFYKDSAGEKRQDAEFHNVVAFGRNAEIAQQYLKKGSMVLIEGRIQTRSWQDSSGNKRTRTEIITERLQLGPRTISSQIASPEPLVSDQNQPPKEITQEEIPIIEEGKDEENPSSTETAAKATEDKDEEIDVSQIPF